MPLAVTFVADAEAELDDAVAYYQGLSPELGMAFVAEVQHGVRLIQRYPQAWRPLGPRVRRYRLNRFPYGLVYAPLDQEIVVVAVMHLHRRPRYWRQRLVQK